MSGTPEFSVEGSIRRRLDAYLKEYWFAGSSAESLWRWQVERRQGLRRAMRLDLPAVYAPPRAVEIENLPVEGLRRELIALETEPDFWLPVYILRPLNTGNGLTLIALHGEGRGAADVAGVASDAADREHIKQSHYDYAQRWARAGFVVAAPELRGYGRLMLADDRKRRDTNPAERLWRNSVERLATIYLRLGQTYAGCCVADLIRLIDYLETRPEVDADRIGVGALGEGARVMSWLIAVEDRISAAVAAGLTKADDETLFGPQIRPPAMADSRTLMDHASIFACFVPRPLMIQAGRRDKDMPLYLVETMLERLGRLYALCDKSDHLAVDAHEGARMLRHDTAKAFFEAWL